MSKKVMTAIAGLSLTAGSLGLAAAPTGAQAGTAREATAATATPKPPKGARAVVRGSAAPQPPTPMADVSLCRRTGCT